jgi:hypothetical protein
LDENLLDHPYQMFYLIWKLSYLFGRQYAHFSLAFEELVESPDTSLRAMLDAAKIKDYDIGALKNLIVRPEIGKWREYAHESWFQNQEATCEQIWMDFAGAGPEVMEPGAGPTGAPDTCDGKRTTGGESGANKGTLVG